MTAEKLHPTTEGGCGMTRVIKLASRPDVLSAGVLAGFWPSTIQRAYKEAKRQAKRPREIAFALPSWESDPRYVIARSGDRYSVGLHYSIGCPVCRVVCLTKSADDPDADADIKDAVLEFLHKLSLRIEISSGRLPHTEISGWSDRSVWALVIGADVETVRAIVDRYAGDNFRHGFAVVVKPALEDKPCES
jgi:hypothetical protein